MTILVSAVMVRNERLGLAKLSGILVGAVLLGILISQNWIGLLRGKQTADSYQI